jgi:hypothetical protein
LHQGHTYIEATLMTWLFQAKLAACGVVTDVVHMADLAYDLVVTPIRCRVARPRFGNMDKVEALAVSS